MQAVFEAEITEFLDRRRYQRAGAGGKDTRTGSRNGYREVTVKTAAEPVQLSRPKLRGTTEVFASRLFGLHVTKTNALESLVIASFVRGLSVRYAEAAWPRRSATRPRSPSPRVSAVCGQIKYEYEMWARRCLDGVTPGLLVPGRQLLPDAPRLPGRGRRDCLGHNHRRQARVHRPGPLAAASPPEAWHDRLSPGRRRVQRAALLLKVLLL